MWTIVASIESIYNRLHTTNTARASTPFVKKIFNVGHFFLGRHKTSTMTRSGRARSTVATANAAIFQPQSDGEFDIEEEYGDSGGEYKKERRTKKKADATNRFI